MTLITAVRSRQYLILMADSCVVSDDSRYTIKKIIRFGNVVLASSTNDIPKEQRFLSDIEFKLKKIESIDELLDILSSESLRETLGDKKFKMYKDVSNIILGLTNSMDGIKYTVGFEPEKIMLFGTVGSGLDIAHVHLQAVNKSLGWSTRLPNTPIARRAMLEAYWLASISKESIALPIHIIYLPQMDNKFKIESVDDDSDEWLEIVGEMKGGIRGRYSGSSDNI